MAWTSWPASEWSEARTLPGAPFAQPRAAGPGFAEHRIISGVRPQITQTIVERSRFLGRGMDMIAKPFEIDVLLGRVRAMLD
jgi:hypothetical protein